MVAPAVLALLATPVTSSQVQAQERGFLGINLECQNCQREDRSGVSVWWFSEHPSITWIREDGPASRAGLHEGDVILAVAGIDLTTDEGGRAFGSLRAGDPTEFLIRRGGEEVTVTVTPGSPAEAFGEEYAVVMFPEKWDSVMLQMKMLYERQIQIQIALGQAERALAVTEAEAQRTSSAQQKDMAIKQRAQIDSMRLQLGKWQRAIRIQADSLAARTLKVMPRAVEVELAAPESRAVTYSDAVAGARFQALDEDSPLVSDFEGVDGGLLIVKVVENTPAHRAGLRQGDVVLTANGVPVRTVKELRKVVGEGGEAKLTFARKGKKRTCKIGTK